MSLFQVPVLIKKKKAVLMTHMFVKSERERAMFTPEEQARRDVKTVIKMEFSGQ